MSLSLLSGPVPLKEHLLNLVFKTEYILIDSILTHNPPSSGGEKKKEREFPRPTELSKGAAKVENHYT
jgi:hypothetical protein